MVGWVVLNTLIAAQIIHAVNTSIPGWASILITALSTLTVALFGHKPLHAFEHWALIPCLAVFFVLVVTFARSSEFTPLLRRGVQRGRHRRRPR